MELSPTIDNLPSNTAAEFLGKRSFDQHSQPDGNSRSTVNAYASGDARMIVGDVVTTTTITGQVKKIKIYNFPEVQVGYSSRIAEDSATILRWLTSTDQRSIYENMLALRHPQTNRWLIDHEDFNFWKRAQDCDGRSLLWLHGGVGCGKTILCASVIEELVGYSQYPYDADNFRLCYFFFSFQDSTRSDLSALLRSLLSQLSMDTSVPTPIVELYMRCHQTFPTRSPTLLQLQEALHLVLTEELLSRKVYFIIDALDEVMWGPQREEVLEFVSTLSNYTTTRFRAIVSSRNEPDIRYALDNSGGVWKHFPVQLQQVDQDIEKFINEGIEKHLSLKRQNEHTKALIREKLIQNANGMFRWSALQLSSLKRLRVPTPSIIEQTLAKLPKDLNETYVRILGEIDDSLLTLAVRALKWLVVSKRALYIEELADASSDRLQDVTQSPYDFRKTALEPFHLVEMLRDLVEVQPTLPHNIPPEPRQHKITLSHFSVQEFLLEGYIETSPAVAFAFSLQEAHCSVAQDCLAYLYRFNSPPSRLDSVKSRMMDFALREYAWYNWEKHVLPGPGNEAINDPARRKATVLYLNFKTRSSWTEEDTSNLTFWLPSDCKPVLLQALNIPWFYPNLGGYFETPAGPHEDPRWFGDRTPDPESKEIGLITILPCLDPEEDLRCQLNIVSLRDSPAFKAISYALGPADNSPIFIGGTQKSVRPQLANTFRNLRLHQEGDQPKFWADAICLEEWQSSSSTAIIERDHLYYTDTRLLVMLTEIFKEAHEVAISLGDEMPDDEQALTLIHKLVSRSRPVIEEHVELFDSEFYKEIVRLEATGGWSIMDALLSRMWWQRRWTIQEMVLARSAVIFLGSLAFSFDVIDRFVELEPLIRRCLESIHGPFGQAYHEVFDSQGWDRVKNLSQSRQEYSKSGPIALTKLLWRFRLHTGMYREDVLRTIVPLTWEASSGVGFEVAWDETTLFRLDLPEAIAKAFKSIISESNGLDILSLNSAYSIDQTVNVDKPAPQTWYPAMERDALEVQPFVSTMTDERCLRLFRACGTEEYTYQFADECMKTIEEVHYWETKPHGHAFSHFSQDIDNELNPSRISLKGAKVDTIERLSEAYTTDIRDKAILDFTRRLISVATQWATEWSHTQARLRVNDDQNANTNNTMGGVMSNEAIWRTLLADQYHPGLRLPILLPDSGYPDSLPPRNVEDIERFLSVPATQKALRFLYGRRLFMTGSGRVGLAPFGAQPGDTVVILAGGSVPFVLRATEKKMVGHFIFTPLWNFIGECYVHGIMDGELLVSSASGKPEVQFQPFVLEAEMRQIPASERPQWREQESVERSEVD